MTAMSLFKAIGPAAAGIMYATSSSTSFLHYYALTFAIKQTTRTCWFIEYSLLFRLQRFVGSFSWSEKRQDASFLPGNVKSSCSYIHIDQLVI